MKNREVLTINDFTALLLSSLARDDESYQDKDVRVAVIPMQYKQIIENILCIKRDWMNKFSVLIDTDEYFLDHFLWENKFATAIKNLSTKVEVNLENDTLRISFPSFEVKQILDKYDDKKIKSVIDDFTYLFNSYIFSRIYQERFYDYYAQAVREVNRRYVIENSDEKKKKRLFRKKDEK